MSLCKCLTVASPDHVTDEKGLLDLKAERRGQMGFLNFLEEQAVVLLLN